MFYSTRGRLLTLLALIIVYRLSAKVRYRVSVCFYPGITSFQPTGPTEPKNDRDDHRITPLPLMICDSTRITLLNNKVHRLLSRHRPFAQLDIVVAVSGQGLAGIRSYSYSVRLFVRQRIVPCSTMLPCIQYTFGVSRRQDVTTTCNQRQQLLCCAM